jgi:hypothetical protein
MVMQENNQQTNTEQRGAVRAQIRQQTIGYITSALGLVAGLAWNDAIKDLITKFVPGQSTLVAKFIYAVIITIFVVLLTVYLMKIFKVEDKK